ncbi:MATE family efflux transporter [Faecalibacterium prausnitzii]|uniref:MATE family efflux transporter n=1 Tax=Faecalibacterium prausnitzii TaxID=853 RepID=UPI003DA17E27
MKSDKSDFAQGSIPKKLALFMLPILGALVLQAAYGAVDLLVVGRFGTTSGLSAVSTGSQVLNLVTFVVTQFAMGITVLIARYLGEKHPEYIGRVVVGTVVSAITAAAQAVSVVCAVAMLLKKHLPFQLKKTDFRLNLQCRKFLDIGLPLALQEFLTQVSFLALCAFVNRLGHGAGTLLVRLPMAYIMSIQPNASLTMIGLAVPTSTAVGIVLNVCFFLYLERKEKNPKV